MVECLDISILKLQCCKFLQRTPVGQQFAGSPLLRLQVIDKHMATITELIVVEAILLLPSKPPLYLLPSQVPDASNDIRAVTLHISQIVHTDSENRIIACMKPTSSDSSNEVTTLCCGSMCISSNRHFAIAPNMRRLCSLPDCLALYHP